MPFMGIDRPSIQLGLLKAIGERNGFDVRTLHANLDFAARIGVDSYRALAETRGPLVGDWLFSVEAFGERAPDPAGRLPDEAATDLAYLRGTGEEVRERLLRIRDLEVPALLDSLADAVKWDDVQVVGFSCTFQQNTASFALARRLKRQFPHLVTVFGGANFDGEMGSELARTVDCIDLAVSGEADAAFPRLLTALATGTDPAAVPGVCRRAGDTAVATPPEPPYQQLDELPLPDYGEYFERAERLKVVPRAARRQVWLPFESARGCWWGVRHHCTFCGLNGTTMPFRSKSPARVLDELAGLARRYGSFRFEAVDNILDPRYLRELFPAIADSGAGYEFFYEAKANLTRAHLRVLARGGVSRLQPGLESLSSTVLRLMDKGVRAAQNVNLLRWARYYGIDVAWSILWGFPGESAQDYAEQAAAVPDLVHLQPPEHSGRIWLERFSPLYRRPARFGLRRCEPDASYRYIYPKEVDLDRVAYFFDYEVDGALPDSAYEPLRQALDGWVASWRSGPHPALTYWSAPGILQIHDARHAGRDGTYTFEGTLADIYLACTDRPITAAAVRERLRLDRTAGYVQEVLDEFQRRGLMFRDERLAVALALPAVPGR
ncbi:RiPP maturation radical SAM C-methyltransferase [Actinoplanes sp. GCM10030250]|uniref:RiPP maturation radical SAM C-methyltransferase n=1 Tax=Actinoplanes sp. GCM10030250 TaxID=3273376 RepID=UPI0036707C2C